MKIWFDISNSPHINLFASLIREIRTQHEIIITCRPLANTIDLLEGHGFEFEVVGKHYGASTLKKAYGYPVRVAELYRYLRGRKPDVAISQSSFHSPVVARLLGIRAIYLNDNEHALGNVPSFLAAHTIMIPEYLDIERVLRRGATRKKVIQYPGVKEGIYLWNSSDLHIPSRAGLFTPNGRKTVFVRPEPWTAQYYSGRINFLGPLLLFLREHLNVVLLPRGPKQAEYFQTDEFSGITVLETALGLADIVPRCDLFLGAGGTMTREMAVLGIPTISVYQADLLDVDRYLMRNGLMMHSPEITGDGVLRFLENAGKKPPNRLLLDKGRQAYELIKHTLLEEVPIP